MENIEKSMEKSNIPYYQVAKQVLMNRNGLSEEEAEKVISSQSFDEIESQVNVKGSMDYAIEQILDTTGFFNDKDVEGLSAFIYEGGQSDVIDSLKEDKLISYNERVLSKGQSLNRYKRSKNELIMDILIHVHDGRVRDNVKNFNAGKKKQYMPSELIASELIGWKELKADLLFVRPIFEATRVDGNYLNEEEQLYNEINEEELEQVYNERVKDFFLNNGIKTASDLSAALKGYGKILTTINDPEYVDEKIIPAIEQEIGNIEEVRKNIVSQIINNPTPEDVAKLSDEEKSQEKQSLVQRIMDLADRRKKLKEEISKEEETKLEITEGLDD